MQSYHTNTYTNVRVSMVSLEASRHTAHGRGVTRAAKRPHSRPAALWPVRAGTGADSALSPALSAASTAQKSSVAAVAASAASAVEAAVERGAVLVASAAEHRLFGVEVDVGHHW